MSPLPGILEMLQQGQLAPQLPSAEQVAQSNAPELGQDPPAPALPFVDGGGGGGGGAGGGFLADLFGGESGQDLSPSQRKKLGRSALFNAGLSAIEGSAPRPSPGSIGGFTPDNLQAITAGLRGGQQAFAFGADREAKQGIKDNREKAFATIRDEGSSPEAIQDAMLSLGGGGDFEGFEAAQKMLALRKPQIIVSNTGEAFARDPVSGELTQVIDGTTGAGDLKATDRDLIETRSIRLFDDKSDLANLGLEGTQLVRASAERLLQGDNPGGATANALVSGFLKALDPRSAVLQGERQSLENSGNIPNRFKNLVAKFLEGEPSETLIKEMVDVVVDSALEREIIFNDNRRREVDRLGRLGIGKADEFLQDPYAAIRADRPEFFTPFTGIVPPGAAGAAAARGDFIPGLGGGPGGEGGGVDPNLLPPGSPVLR